MGSLDLIGRSKSLRDKGNRNRGSRKPKAKPEARPTRPHPLYGEIPLIPAQVVDDAGKERHYYEFDLDYQPPLPPGAVRGDVRRQEFCPLCHVPRYFFVDQEKECVQCGKKFVFSAKEQKYWYETLKFNFHSVAIRCRLCRRRRRSQSAVRHQIQQAKRRLEAAPEDAGCLLALAEATVTYHRMAGEGDLNAAVHAARRVQKLWPSALAAIFWEAACHSEAGRTEKAVKLYRAFLARSPRGRKYRELIREARTALAAADDGPAVG